MGWKAERDLSGRGRFGGCLAAAILAGLSVGSALARDLTEPPLDLAVAAPDPRREAASKASQPIVKNKKKDKSAAQDANSPINSEPQRSASGQPAVHSKDAKGGDDPVSFGMKWNGTNESYGAATSLREINQTINRSTGVNAQPVGAGAAVGVRYKF
jgi:hypothetical protein